VTKFFNDPRLIKLFNRYATYNDSDPFKAPATLNIIPYVEYGFGGFYIDGGMYRLVESINSLAVSMDIEIHTDTAVEKILHENGSISGIRANGESIKTDYVLCGTDVVETHQNLIDGYERYSKKLNKLEPSLSGLVFMWGIRKVHDQLAHHNIFFSSDYRQEFHQIFDDLKAPADPTIYLSITSKQNPGHAPENCENWFILLNMPYVQEYHDWDAETDRLREITLKKLKAFGYDIKSYISLEKSFSPTTFLKLYASNKGSIYGISSNTRVSAFMRPANRSRKIQGLYFAGGSVHPGGGIPLVILSGKMAAELIAKKEDINVREFIEKTSSLSHISKIQPILN
jgi:phytoene desaturase